MNDSVRTYWWNQKENFGDALTPFILKNLTRRKVEWAQHDEAELFCIGSLFRLISDRSSQSPFNSNRPLYVWGTGVMTPNHIKAADFNFFKSVNIRAVRGPLTSKLIDPHSSSSIALGDPGLLIPEIFQPKRFNFFKSRIGLVLHHSQKLSDDILFKIQKQNIKIKIIYTDTNDIYSVLNKIARCQIILSSSLHGLIAADALNIPNTWINTGGIHVNPRFKFYDYALGVQRTLPDHYDLNNIKNALKFVQSNNFGYFKKIPEIVLRLKDSFPHELA
jgi:pyruvyltransferase